MWTDNPLRNELIFMQMSLLRENVCVQERRVQVPIYECLKWNWQEYKIIPPWAKIVAS